MGAEAEGVRGGDEREQGKDADGHGRRCSGNGYACVLEELEEPLSRLSQSGYGYHMYTYVYIYIPST